MVQRKKRKRAAKKGEVKIARKGNLEENKGKGRKAEKRRREKRKEKE